MQAPCMIAGGDIRPCRFVKQSTSANQTLLEADANESIVGISQEGTKDAPQSGSSALAAAAGDEVFHKTLGELALLEIGSGGCTAADELKSDADGKGVTVALTGTTIQEIGAIAHETASEGEKAWVRIWRSQRRPALA